MTAFRQTKVPSIHQNQELALCSRPKSEVIVDTYLDVAKVNKSGFYG